MIVLRRSAIASCLGVCLYAHEARAQAQAHAMLGVIDGVVTDTALAPVNEATIAILGSSVRVVTGPNGRFRLRDLPGGMYIVTVSRFGYQPITTTLRLADGDTLRPSYEMLPTGTVLGTVNVTGTRASQQKADFEARMALGRGHFMTEAEIAKRNAPIPTELIRTFSSIDVVPDPGRSAGSGAYYAMSRRGEGAAVSKKGPCYMQVLLDGNLMPSPYNLDDLPAPSHIMGIEVYGGPATVPVQFARFDHGCGVIAVWTKD